MSSYPPGVSGNEVEIAGRPTAEMSRECDNKHALFVPHRLVTEYTYWLGLKVARVDKVLSGDWPPPLTPIVKEIEALRVMLGGMVEDARKEEADFACDWSGKVDVEYENGSLFWSCPHCGLDHEEVMEEEEGE